MKDFKFVLYKGEIHVLISCSFDVATIAGIHMVGSRDSFYVYEIDVPAELIRYADPEVSEYSMISRLRDYRKCHNDIFGFAEEEISLIHFF